MQEKDTLRNLLIAAAVFVFVFSMTPRLFPPPPPPSETAAPGAEPGSGATPLADEAPARERSAAAQVDDGDEEGDGRRRFRVVEAEEAALRAMGAAPEEMVGRRSRQCPFRMRLSLTNVGAAILTTTLTDHAEHISAAEPYRLLSPVTGADGATYASFAIEKITVDDVEISLHDRKWNVGQVRRTGEEETLEFWIEIHDGDAPLLRLTRQLRLPRQPVTAGRHDLFDLLTIENLGTQTHGIVLTRRGGVGVPSINDRSDRVFDWGVFDSTRVVGARETYHALAKATGGLMELFSPKSGSPDVRLSWAATANTYFTATVAPRNRDGTDNADYLAALIAADLDGSPLTTDDATVRFTTRAEPMPPGTRLLFPSDLYLGEKDADAFRRVDAYKARNYYFQISKGFGWCTFNWLVELMIWLLNTLYVVTRDYGLAIIILVLIVRVLLHPITKKGQVNMVRMQQKMGELQPKLEELKRKFAGDKTRLQQEQMKLFREAGVNPAGNVMTCLPMLLQMPIWVALFLSLSNNIRMRHQPLHFTWIRDLTAPDALYTFSNPLTVPIFGWELPAFNLLPFLLALFMYLQQKLTPKPKPNPNMTDQQRQQQEIMQKMMPMMSIMMLLIFYKMPSGLNLYIMASSGFGLIEQHFIRRHIRRHEEAGTLLKPTRAATQADASKKRQPSFFERLQKMADEAQKAQPRRNKRKARR